MPPKQKAPPARAAPPPSLQRAVSSSAAAGKGVKKQQPQQPLQQKEEEEEEDDDEEEDEDDEEEDEDGDSGNDTESDDEDDFGEEEEEEEDSDDDGGDSVLDVDFTFSDPRPIDYKSVRRLLERYLPGEEGSFPVGSLADDVIGQRVVGTMVKVSDDGLDDAYAFSTILPLARYASKDWFKALKAFILKRAGPKAGPPLEAALANLGSLGLLLNERIYNMPPELSPAIHDSVLQDVAWAMQQAPGDLRAAFQDLTHVLVMAPCWLEKEDGEEAPAKGGKGKGQGQGEEGVPPGFLSHFLRFEERLWAEEAMVQVAFPVASPAEEQVAAAPTGSGSGSGSGSSGAGAMPVQGSKGGRKRKGGKGKRVGGEEEEEEEEEGEEGDGKAPGDSLRAPQMRRILLVPIGALQKAATAMSKEVEEAKRQRALELAAPPPAAPAAAAAAAGTKKRKV